MSTMGGPHPSENTFHELNHISLPLQRLFLMVSRNKIESSIITFVEPEAIKCTCSRFLKNYICEHVVHSSVDLKERSVPMEYQDRPIGSGPVAGRHVSVQSQAKKMKKSLVTNLYCHELMSLPPRK